MLGDYPTHLYWCPIIELKNGQFPWLLGRHVTRVGQSNVPTRDLYSAAWDPRQPFLVPGVNSLLDCSVEWSFVGS